MQTFESDLVAGSGSTVLKLRLKSQGTKAPLDLSNQTVKMRWQVNHGTVQERTMTVLSPQSDPTKKGRAEYLFLAGDLTEPGTMLIDAVIIDNAGRELPSSTKLILSVSCPLQVTP